MSQPPMADAARSVASVLFNLSEYEVIDVAHDEADGRRFVPYALRLSSTLGSL